MGVWFLLGTRSGLDRVYESEGVSLILIALKSVSTCVFVMVFLVKEGFDQGD